MKSTGITLLVSLLLAGCASSHVATPGAGPYPQLDKPLDKFCRNPKNGIFLLPIRINHIYDVVIADQDGVRLGWIRDGALASIGCERFRSELPTSTDMEGIPLGKSEEEMVRLLGRPSRTWYDLFPIVDAIVPITRVFGRDSKYCDYYLFTTTPSSELVNMTIWVSYKKNTKGNWLAARLVWKIEGTREMRNEQTPAGDSLKTAPEE